MDIKYINDNFPNIELSYDNINHKKVPDLYLAIPYGKKYCLWFTNYKGEDMCYLLEYDIKNKKINNFKKISTFFSKDIAYGTVIYGTQVINNDIKFFVCENIFYYCGKNVINYNFKKIMVLFQDMFLNKIKSIAYNINEYIITLCLMDNNKNNLISNINNQTYDIYGILHRTINNRYSYIVPIQSNRSSKKTHVFRVMADIKYNVYKLYYFNGSKGIELYQKTYIPDYKTSVMLNDKFRIIKENVNLDLLEESDDEEEFENINEDKFVYLDRFYNYKCYFHNKIKRWIPFEITYDKKIATYKDLAKQN